MCSTDANQFPFGWPFKVNFYPKLVNPFPVANFSAYSRVDTWMIKSRIDCCDYAMAQGPAAIGVWRGPNAIQNDPPGCAIYNVNAPQQDCQPQKTLFTLPCNPSQNVLFPTAGETYVL